MASGLPHLREEPWTSERLLDTPGLRENPLFGKANHVDARLLFPIGVVAIVATGAAVATGSLVGVAVVGTTAAAITILRYPVFGAYLLAALVPVLSGVQRGVPVPGLRPSEALVGLVAPLVLLTATKKAQQPWGAVDWLSGAYVTLSIALPTFNMAVRGEPITLASMSPLLLPLQFFLLYRTVRTALVTMEQRRFALSLLLWGSVGVAAVAFAQQLNLGPARRIVQGITASEALESYSYAAYARATGLFQHWHPLAGYLTIIVLICVALLLEPNERGVKRVPFLSRRHLMVILSASVMALMLSVTFVSMLGVIAGSLMLGHWYGRSRLALKWVAIMGVVALVLFGSYVGTRLQSQYTDASGQSRSSLVPQTIQKRIDVWSQEYLPSMSGRWTSGYGAGLPPEVRWTHTESVYVTLLLRGGLPLLMVFVALMISVWKAAESASFDVSRRPEARALMAAVTVLWVMHLLFPYLTSSGLPQPFWILAAIALAGWQNEAPVDGGSG